MKLGPRRVDYRVLGLPDGIKACDEALTPHGFQLTCADCGYRHAIYCRPGSAPLPASLARHRVVARERFATCLRFA